MSTQVSIAAATAAVAPGAAGAPADTSWASGLVIAAALLLMVGCVAGVGAGWWYLGERRRVRRCRDEVPLDPHPEAPPTTDFALASQGVDQSVARPRSPRHSAAVPHRVGGRRPASARSATRAA